MARTFTTGNYLTISSAAAPPSAGTVFVRYKPAWSSGEGVDHYLWSYYQSSNVSEFAIRRFSDNSVYAGRYISGGDARIVISDAGLFAAGVWANWLLDYDQVANLQHLYVNNVLVGTQTAAFSLSPAGAELVVGISGSHVSPANADIAEFAIWDHVLDSTERATLQSTGNPACVPSGLTHHWKILGADSPEPDEIGSDSLTLVGTPVQSTHPDTTVCPPGARLLTAGNYLENTAVASSARDFTLFMRIKPNWSSGDSLRHVFFIEFFDLSQIIVFLTNPDNFIYAGVIVTTGAVNRHYLTLAAAGLFTAGVWANWRMEVEGTVGTVRLYKDGTLVGSGTVDAGTFPAIASPLSLTIGDDPLGGGNPADAHIAEVGEWDHILSSEDAGRVEATGNPACVSTGLVRHYHVGGYYPVEFDLVGSDDLVEVGSPTITAAPPISTCSPPGARTFTSGNLLTKSSPTTPPAIGSAFIRAKPTWSSGDSVAHVLWVFRNAGTGELLFLDKDADNLLYFGWSPAVGGPRFGTVADAGLFTAGVWANWLITWENVNGQITIYKNGTMVAQTGLLGAFTLPTFTSLAVGAALAGSSAFEGDEAQFAIWDHILNPTEMTTLESTGNPACLSTGLLHHYHLGGYYPVEFDLVGSDDLTQVGTPAIVTGPSLGTCSGSTARTCDQHHLLGAAA